MLECIRLARWTFFLYDTTDIYNLDVTVLILELIVLLAFSVVHLTHMQSVARFSWEFNEIFGRGQSRIFLWWGLGKKDLFY